MMWRLGLVLVCVVVATRTYCCAAASAATRARRDDFWTNGHSTQNDGESSRLLLLLIDRLGLANRLRTIADWYKIAIFSNRTLLVSWKATLDCNISFHELFDEGPNKLEVLPSKSAILGGIEEAEALIRMSGTTFLALTTSNPNFWLPTSGSFVLARDSGVLSDVDIIVTDYDGVLTFEGVECAQYLQMHSDFLSSLKPVTPAIDFVKDFKKSYAVGRVMIGIHYRSHDAYQDWAVVPPMGSQTQASKFGEGATLNDFLSVMAQIEDKFRGRNRFFIASNDPDGKARLLRAFPDSVALNGDSVSYSRTHPDGVYFAFLEWLLLSESYLIINTYGSSFAVEAAQRNMIPIVGIWNHELIYHTDTRLPYCGHMQYMKVSKQELLPY
jgi:hypothetical protein